MWYVDVCLPCGKKIIFEQQEKIVICNHPVLLDRLEQNGVPHLNGKKYFPKDGEKFLEAIYDYYWLKGLRVEWL